MIHLELRGKQELFPAVSRLTLYQFVRYVSVKYTHSNLHLLGSFTPVYLDYQSWVLDPEIAKKYF